MMRLIVSILIICICSCLGDSIDDKHLRKVKDTLLQMFGLNERPVRIADAPVSIPETMKEMYDRQMNFELDTASIPVEGLHSEGANTIRSYIHNESQTDKRFEENERLMRLRFNVTLPPEESLKAAELKFFIDPHIRLGKRKRTSRFQRIYLYDIVKPGSKKLKSEPILRLLDTKIVDIYTNQSVSLDPQAAVSRWVKTKNRENYGVLIRVSPLKKEGGIAGHIRLRRAVDEPKQEWTVKRPVLLVYSDDGRNLQKFGTDMINIRSKRAARRGHRKGDRDSCRRQQMYVNFSDVGWSDWIVAPLGYDAFFCGGECVFPLAEHMNTTNHAIVQSLMHSVRPYDVPRACCVPTQLSSMSMLYVDSQGSVILKNYKEMVVTGCGCR